MPNRPKRICPQCQSLYEQECQCGYGKHGWEADAQRGTRQERGYDAAWQRLRAYKLANNPLCEECEADGKTRPAREVHHIRPFHGLSDTLRLDYANLQSLCSECHRRKAKGRR